MVRPAGTGQINRDTAQAQRWGPLCFPFASKGGIPRQSPCYRNLSQLGNPKDGSVAPTAEDASVAFGMV